MAAVTFAIKTGWNYRNRKEMRNKRRDQRWVWRVLGKGRDR